MSCLSEDREGLTYVVTATRNSRMDVITFPIGIYNDKDTAIESAKEHKEKFGKHYDYYVYGFIMDLTDTSSPPIFVV